MFSENFPKLWFHNVDLCCALCPLELTYQRFGMAWDAWNDVGMMNYIFLYINVCSAYFVIFHWGVWASLIFAPSWACRTVWWGHNNLTPHPPSLLNDSSIWPLKWAWATKYRHIIGLSMRFQPKYSQFTQSPQQSIDIGCAYGQW